MSTVRRFEFLMSAQENSDVHPLAYRGMTRKFRRRVCCFPAKRFSFLEVWTVGRRTFHNFGDNATRSSRPTREQRAFSLARKLLQR